MDAVPSTLHQVIKFPSPWGICQIRGDQHTSRAINSIADTSTRSEEVAVSAVLVQEEQVTDPDANEKHLQEAKGNWPEVLPDVLWAYRTTAKTSTGETPFSLVYGAEALIPVEIGEPSTRFMQATEESNSEEMRVNLDLLEGRREAALIRMTTQKKETDQDKRNK
uniref:Uncharacterized protein LOC104214860 n=1 Tax=Nicotiana sylvestris TaxID=4096 RepID=A0A1U7VM08_NICSY|nr:PREDICTED: uncharacterized protein LOC104214860 [Nicotiana sylvestris]